MRPKRSEGRMLLLNPFSCQPTDQYFLGYFDVPRILAQRDDLYSRGSKVTTSAVVPLDPCLR